MNATASSKDGAMAVDDETNLQDQKTLKSEEYRKLFHLPPEETLIADFNCALQKKILLQGHMYLFERYVCFYSNIFGYEKKKIVPLKDVTCVRKARTASVFPNAIEIVSWGKKHFFASFLSRDEAFRLIIDGWVQHSSYAKLFLHSQGSLASLAMSPQSRTTSGVDNGALTQSALRSPLLMTRLEAAGNYESRVDEMAAKLAASAEAAESGGLPENVGLPENGASHAINGLYRGDRMLEDEGTPRSSTSSVGQQHSLIWEVEDSDVPPLPDSYKTVAEAEFSVDVEEFFQLFFSDEGVAFSKDFHSACGDEDFRCTQWVKHRQFGHARDISFRHPINFYFGPKSTYCHESQRFRVYKNNCMVLETTQQMTDIPYGDYFQVQVRWDVEQLYRDDQCHCSVRVSIDVTFSKKTIWKSKIEQGTIDECKEAYASWILLAKAVLHETKSLAVKHENGIVPAESITGHEVPQAECTWSDELVDTTEGLSERTQDIINVGAASRTHSQGGLIFLSQPEWATKASSAVKNGVSASHRGWQKLSELDWTAGKRHMKLVLFMLIAVIIVSMQVGIIITLMWPQNVKPAYRDIDNEVGSCLGGGGSGGGDETLGWLERRFHHIKEEIAMTELRLQDLHLDLAALKSHADRFQRHLSQSIVECQTTQTGNL